MSSVIQYMQNELPDHNYLLLVNRNLLLRQQDKLLVDPFAPDIASDRALDAYVEREDVEASVYQPGWGILLGRKGIGKTTLVRYCADSLTERKPPSLVIPIPMARIFTTLPSASFNAGEISILTSEKVTTLIFEAFWNDFIVRRSSPEYLRTLRRNNEWMRTLRAFYRLCGVQTWPVEDFELHTWLRAEDADPPLQKSWESRLQKLLTFITKPEGIDDYYGSPRPWPYRRIRLFVDGAERFSGAAAHRLIRDSQQIYYAYGEHLDVKLFLDTAHDSVIRQLSCIREGRVPIYQLPNWTRSEMRSLLTERILAYHRSGDTVVLDNAAQRLPLPAPAKMHFWDIILNTVPESAVSDTSTSCTRLVPPTPLQILRLTRGLLAAVAGSIDEYVPPLTTNDLKKIVADYCDSELQRG